MGFLTAALDEITRDVVGVRPQERGRGQAFADHRSQPTTFSVEATVSDTLANLVCSGFKLTIQGESDAPGAWPRWPRTSPRERWRT